MQAGELKRLAPVEVVSVRAHRVLGAAGQPEVEVEVTTRQGAFHARAGVPFVGPEVAAGEAAGEGEGGEEGEGVDAVPAESDEAGSGEGEAPGGEAPAEETAEGAAEEGDEAAPGEERVAEEKSELTIGEEVDLAVQFLGEVLAPAVIGHDPREQAAADEAITGALHGHAEASGALPPKFSAMVTLGLSLALCRAGAAGARDGNVVEHLAQLAGNTRPVVPVPAFTLINGGGAGDNPQLSLRAVQAMPTGADTFAEALEMGAASFQALRGLVQEQHAGDVLKVGAEGGLVPGVAGPEEALTVAAEAVEAVGCTGKVKIAVDAAAGDLYDAENDTYRQSVGEEAGSRSAEDLISQYETLCTEHGVISIHDPFAAGSLECLSRFTAQGACQVVGGIGGERGSALDAAQVIEAKAYSTLRLQLRDLHTLSDAIKVAQLAQKARCGLMVVHPPDAAGDTFAADLAVGLAAGQADFGAPRASGALCDRLRALEAAGGLPFAGEGYRFVAWA